MSERLDEFLDAVRRLVLAGGAIEVRIRYVPDESDAPPLEADDRGGYVETVLGRAFPAADVSLQGTPPRFVEPEDLEDVVEVAPGQEGLDFGGSPLVDDARLGDLTDLADLAEVAPGSQPEIAVCGVLDPYDGREGCALALGHRGYHRVANASWS